jgi:putative transposase
MSAENTFSESNESILANVQPLDGASLASSVMSSGGLGEGSSESDQDNPPQADEFSDEELEEFGTRYQLVCLVRAGKSPREALDHLGVKGSESWVRKLCKRYEERGPSGLLDGRSCNGSDRKLLTKEVEDMTLALWYAHPAAGSKAIWEELKRVCPKHIKCPKYDVIKKFLKNRPLHDKLVRAGKIEVWDKQARPVVRFNITSYANERWQVDHSRLDIWVREKVNGKWQPAEVYLSVALDAHSRAIAGIWLSTRFPDSWSVALLLRQAVLPKSHPDWKNRGIPSVYQPDRGKDFMANSVFISLGYLGISRDPDPPHYPNRKGKIERWFLTLDRGCLRMLPGHMAAIGHSRGAAEKRVAELLELPDLREEIIRYIVENYHQRTHSETGRKPAEMWEETVLLRTPESEDALNALLLKADKTRKVENNGITLTICGVKGDYWAPPLVDYVRQDVQIRLNPDDRRSVLVYSVDTGEFICEAFLMGQEDSPYTIEDVARVRSQYRQGLLERMSSYAKKAEEFDRPHKEAAQRQKARQIAQKHAEKETTSHGSVKDDGLGAARHLLARLERRVRTEG